MARKNSNNTSDAPTLFDLSKFQVQLKHPDDIDVETAEWVREKPAVRSLVEVCPDCQHFELDGRFCQKYAIRFRPGEQLLLENVCKGFLVKAPEVFLCNNGDANNLDLLHKKNGPGNFLCNNGDANNPDLLHKKNDPDNFLCNNGDANNPDLLHKKNGPQSDGSLDGWSEWEKESYGWLLDAEFCTHKGKTRKIAKFLPQQKTVRFEGGQIGKDYISMYEIEPYRFYEPDPNDVLLLHKKIDRLDMPQLQDLMAYVQDRLKLLAKEDDQIPLKEGRELVEVRRVGAVTYQLEKTRCGKDCRKCPHGPYWYAYYRRGGRLVSKYIGKELS